MASDAKYDDRAMPRDRQLMYQTGGSTNLQQWYKDLGIYMKKRFQDLGEIVVQKKIPKGWNDFYVYDKTKYGNVEYEALTGIIKKNVDAAVDAHNDRKTRLETKLSSIISVIIDDTLSQSSRLRIEAVAKAEFKKIAEESTDIEGLFSLIDRTHTFTSGSSKTYTDKSKAQDKFKEIQVKPKETLEEFHVRFTNLVTDVELMGAVIEVKDMVYHYCTRLRDHSDPVIKEQAIKILEDADEILEEGAVGNFPTTVDEVNRRIKKRLNAMGTSEKTSNELKGVHSIAYGEAAPISKPNTTNQKPPSGKPSARIQNPKTEEYVANQMRKHPERTRKEVIEKMRGCKHCGKKHFDEDHKDLGAKTGDQKQDGKKGGKPKSKPGKNKGRSYSTNAYGEDEDAEAEEDYANIIATSMGMWMIKSVVPAVHSTEEKLGVWKPFSAKSSDDHWCINLDNHANINIFRNKDLLTNLRNLAVPHVIKGSTGEAEFGTVGDHPHFGETIYNPKAEYNIVALCKANDAGFVHSYVRQNDNSESELVNPKTGVRYHFRRDPNDRFDKCYVPKKAISEGDIGVMSTDMISKLNTVLSDSTPHRDIREKIKKAAAPLASVFKTVKKLSRIETENDDSDDDDDIPDLVSVDSSDEQEDEVMESAPTKKRKALEELKEVVRKVHNTASAAPSPLVDQELCKSHKADIAKLPPFTSHMVEKLMQTSTQKILSVYPTVPLSDVPELCVPPGIFQIGVLAPPAPPRYYTVQEQERANRWNELHISLHHPSDAYLNQLLLGPDLRNHNLSPADGANYRDMHGPCPGCGEGKPQPSKNRHPSHDPEDVPTRAGQYMESDIVFIGRKRFLFSVCLFSGYKMLIKLADGTARGGVQPALETVIASLANYGKPMEKHFSDSDNAFLACADFFVRRGITPRYSIPYEHATTIERNAKTVREKMLATKSSLPYKLPEPYEEYLAYSVVQYDNITPNSKSLPHTPRYLMRGDKPNFQTDFGAPFGSVCLLSQADQKDGSEKKHEIGISLGKAPNHTGGFYFAVQGHRDPLIRRPLKWMPMTKDLQEYMNKMAELKPGSADEQLFFYNQRISAARQEEMVEEADRQESKQTDPEIAQSEVTVGETIPISTEVVNVPSLPIGRQDVETHLDEVLPESIERPSNTVTPNVVDIPAPSAPPTNRRTVARVPAVTAVGESVTDPVGERSIARDRERRTIKRPARFGSNVTNLTSPINNTPFRRVYQMTLAKALKSPRATEAEKAAALELRSIVDLKTWEYRRGVKDAEPTIHKTVVPCSMFLKDKYDSRGEFLKYKARLVGGGHRVDSDLYQPHERSSPTVAKDTVNIQLVHSINTKSTVESFDLPTAYMHARLEKGKSHLMRLPAPIVKILCTVDERAKRYTETDGTVLVQVYLALYGFPESSLRWNEHLSKVLISLGYEQCEIEPCYFKKARKGPHGWELSYISIHVDDCLHSCNSERLRNELYAGLRNARINEPTIQKLTLQSPISHLGVLITLNEDRTLFLSQPAYVNEILTEYPPTKRYKTPSEENLFHYQPKEGTDEATPVDKHQYLSKLMKVMYLGTNTRPDLLTALSGLSMHMQQPLQWHMKVLDRVIGYLALTKDAGITLRACNMEPRIFVDSGFAQHSDMFGHTGGIVLLGDDDETSFIMAKSSKQKQIVTSSTACELVGLSTWVDITLRIRSLLKFQLNEIIKNIIIFQDNTSAITIAYMGRISSNCNNKFMDIRFAYIKQFLDNKVFQLRYLPREAMLADLLASPRVGTKFRVMVEIMLGTKLDI